MSSTGQSKDWAASNLHPRTCVIEGPLAYSARRIKAARASECGLQIVTLPQLAARLAGGFATPLTAEHLEPAVQKALDQGGFEEIEQVRQLPGMSRAVARTLRKIWDADLDLTEARLAAQARIRDLALIEARLKLHLPSMMMLPRAMRDAAIRRMQFAKAIVGPVSLEGLSFIPPVWRQLIMSLDEAAGVEWFAPDCADTNWFSGQVKRPPTLAPAVNPSVVSCADPQHESIESLRWARQLVTSGRAAPHEIAIAAVSTAPWDDYFLALAADADIALYFPHGIPALGTRDGQRCAALADILLRGLNQSRVRRLFTLARGQGLPLDRLPENWLSSIARDATLTGIDDWRRAIAAAVSFDPSLSELNSSVPLLELLGRGTAASAEAAEAFLQGRSLQIWRLATRSAPADALELSLRNARLAMDAGADRIVWCSARELAASPRPYVRLLGLTNRGWPRRTSDDPILPDHILATHYFDIDPIPAADRRHFELILKFASGDLILSRSRHGAQGGRVGRSPLIRNYAEMRLSRARIPEHAFSHADRLVARPTDAQAVGQIKSASQCWSNWHIGTFTSHDGKFDPNDPLVRQAVDQPQSATSLQRLLRDPLAFVWRYALGWNVPASREQPLSISPEDLGKLVHELLRRAVDLLEPQLGYTTATAHQIETALEAAVAAVRDSWPLDRAVPPKLLWHSTVDHAAAMALVGLQHREINEPNTRSYTEVPFGQARGFVEERDLPWDPTQPVTIPNTTIALRGTIDRLDLRSNPFAVRVTDYKTGKRPDNFAGIQIAGGLELQRALYGLACRQLLKDPAIIARLLYLRDGPAASRLGDLDRTIDLISEFAREAVLVLHNGTAVPGSQAYDKYNEFRLALPASPAYERRKRVSHAKAASSLSRFWSER